MISYQRCTSLSGSAGITLKNMRPYYEHYSVDWDQEKILQQIASLQNWDILCAGEVVGAIRIALEGDACYLRDLQVSDTYQNRGIGAKALEESRRLAIESGASELRLKVFKISPAHHLYSRNGFEVFDEDERFYYMVQKIF
ncbi:GNAT family N-acetyltransferase [Aliiglaciecola sp. CAU 1673]|uniref:GNAT family N-acetyltransferase n=1 Tax=Aliiglaciecola sp. CAU 1673 TaxID=3032595 RepID=UPI0023DC5FC9|nr:GNAT family N-acetyltransferase [Aliiglaciecola sp. CAU 1673]MDF2178891.1 GNAT family N-acetyltransferase [Aliiglaciecola sp. CAU 1673]